MKKLFIKITKDSTNFIVLEGSSIILWESFGIGENIIIEDLSKCLSLKLNDAKELASNLVLKESISFKNEEKTKEIIEARLLEIFEMIKSILTEKGIKDIAVCFLTSDNRYIPNAKEILNKVMGVESRIVDLKNIKLKTPYVANKFIKDIFKEF